METKKFCCLCVVILELSAMYFVETLQISHTSSKIGVSSVIKCTSDNGNDMDWIVDDIPIAACLGATANSCLPPCTECSSVITSPATTFSYTLSSVGYTSCKKYGCKEGITALVSEFTLEVTDFSVDNSTAVLNPQEPTANTDGNVSITTPCIFPTSSDAITINWYKIFVNKSNQAELLDANDADIQPYSETDTNGCSTCGTKSAGKMTVGVKFKAPSSNGDEIKLQVEIKHADFTDHLYYTFDQSYYLADCRCECDIHKIVWIVVSIVFSLLSLGGTSFVLIDSNKKGWLKDKLGKHAHLCMIGLVVLNLVYSIIVAILFYVLVCKNDCCEEECDCVCNCWPIYIIIGYVLKAGDVIVIIIGGIAFKEGCRCCALCCSCCSGQSTAACYCCDSDEDDDENPQHGMSNKKRGRTGAASNTVPMSEAHVHATKEPKDAKHKEAMDSHRQQPLPPVGGQKGHERGMSANFGDNNGAVDTKRLPPLSDRSEKTDVKKKKKKKKKNKEEREQD